jgi:pilus assembly protein CpaB
MIAVAAVFGLLAVFVARAWLSSQADARLRSLEANRGKPVATQTLVVANRPLRFGMEVSPEVVREVPWPEDALPPGAFRSIQELTGKGKRVVLTAIEANEPVLSLKITGPGQRATLSALVGPGMKAVTIRVNDVDGVGGFALPGDHVDVILTRQDKETGGTHVLLQNVRVLAVDQIADERAANPVTPKSVTLEVDTVSAQKLGLAASVGTLSLVLRKAGETASSKTARVTLRDLMGEVLGDANREGLTTVSVRRGSQRQNYRVPTENNDAAELPTRNDEAGVTKAEQGQD